MKTEFQNLVDKLRLIFKTERKIEAVFFIIAVLLKTSFGVPFSPGIFGGIIFLFLATFFFDYLLQKQDSLEEAEFICFLYWFFNITFITFIFYCIGNIWWLGAFMIVVPIIHANIMLPQRKGMLLALHAIICYCGFAIAEFLGLIPHQQFFALNEEIYRDPFYLLTGLIVGILLLPYITYITSVSSEVLRERTKELIKTSQELEEIKSVLEIKVKARTRELEDINKGLEQRVEKRTKELQKRVGELQKFHDLTIGREIKMIDLKKKIKELKNQISELEK